MTKNKTSPQNPDEEGINSLINEIKQAAEEEIKQQSISHCSLDLDSTCTDTAQSRYSEYEAQERTIAPVEEVRSALLTAISKLCKEVMDEHLKNQNDSRKRRRNFSFYLSVLMGLQLIALNYFFYLKGINRFPSVSDELFKWFMTESFLQMFGIVVYIIKKSYENTNVQDTVDTFSQINDIFINQTKNIQKKDNDINIPPK